MNKQMTPLRQRMIEDMTIRNMSPSTQKIYVRAVANFSIFHGCSPDKLSFEHVRDYRLHLISRGLKPNSINPIMGALRFFYGTTLGLKEVSEQIPYARREDTLPAVLARDEVVRFLRAVTDIKMRTAFMIGRGVEVLIPERFRAAHPGLRHHFGKSLQTGPMGQGRDLLGLRRNATEFLVEIGLNPFRSGDRLLVVACVIDISERKGNEEHIQFIMHELSHRSKNLLTIVLGIAKQTVGTGDLQKFESRLMALARCHDLLVEKEAMGWAARRLHPSSLM